MVDDEQLRGQIGGEICVQTPLAKESRATNPPDEEVRTALIEYRDEVVRSGRPTA